MAIMESLFSIAYMIVTAILGVMILRGAKGRMQFTLFGSMALILVCGDAFHLVPRIWAGFSGDAGHLTAALGFGTLVTSITMTVFYALLYHFWRRRYGIEGRGGLTAVIYALGVIRIALCLFPQNRWFDADAPVLWGIYRNIPFAILGLLIILLFYSEATRAGDRVFRHMWLAITLSFAFYIPVVLWADAAPLVGILMLPKTCAYVWMIWMGYRALRQ